MLAAFVKWILNPLSIITIILALAVGAAMYQSHRVDKISSENAIAKQEEVIQGYKNTLEILEKDRPLIDKLLQSKQTIYIREQKLQNDLNEIPDTSTNKPFTNPDLLDAARVLRDYQNSSNTGNSTSPNN